jgi:hypothetical protein
VSLARTGGHVLRFFEQSFERKNDDVTGGSRILHNEKFHPM